MTTIKTPTVETISEQQTLFKDLVREVCRVAGTRINLPVRTFEFNGIQYSTLATNKDIANYLQPIANGSSMETTGRQDTAAQNIRVSILHDNVTDKQLGYACFIINLVQKEGDRACIPTDIVSEFVPDHMQGKLNMAKIDAMFEAASERLQRPKVKFTASEYMRETYGLETTIEIKKPKYPNEDKWLTITSGGSYNSSKFYGYIKSDGTLNLYSAGRRISATLIPFLHQLAADPHGVTSAAGKEAGSCCYCSKELTHPQSVKAGFGKRCAKNYGLMEEYRNAK